MEILWKSFGNPMECHGNPKGSPLQNVKVFNGNPKGPPLQNVRNFNGNPKGSPLQDVRNLKGNPKGSYGNPFEILWKSYGSPME